MSMAAPLSPTSEDWPWPPRSRARTIPYTSEIHGQQQQQSGGGGQHRRRGGGVPSTGEVGMMKSSRARFDHTALHEISEDRVRGSAPPPRNGGGGGGVYSSNRRTPATAQDLGWSVSMSRRGKQPKSNLARATSCRDDRNMMYNMHSSVLKAAAQQQQQQQQSRSSMTPLMWQKSASTNSSVHRPGGGWESLVEAQSAELTTPLHHSTPRRMLSARSRDLLGGNGGSGLQESEEDDDISDEASTLSNTPLEGDIDLRFAQQPSANGAGGSYLTFVGVAKAPPTKLHLYFDPKFWEGGACCESAFFEELKDRYLALYSSQEAHPKLRTALREFDRAASVCGSGLLEVERNLHRLVVSPPSIVPPTPQMEVRSRSQMPLPLGEQEETGPSYYVLINRNSRNSGLSLSSSAANPNANHYIPYVSDCYDSLSDPQDYTQAWHFLLRSGTIALLGNSDAPSVVVASLCSRDFVHFAYLSYKNPNAPSNGVLVSPLTAKLYWKVASHRHQILTVSLSIAAWLGSLH